MHAKFVAMSACGCLQSHYVSAALCSLVTHLVFFFGASPQDVQSCIRKTVLKYAWRPLAATLVANATCITLLNKYSPCSYTSVQMLRLILRFEGQASTCRRHYKENQITLGTTKEQEEQEEQKHLRQCALRHSLRRPARALIHLQRPGSAPGRLAHNTHWS